MKSNRLISGNNNIESTTKKFIQALEKISEQNPAIRFDNFRQIITQHEIKDKQGFDVRGESKRNIEGLRKNLQAGWNYINQHIVSEHAHLPESKQDCYQHLGKMGITKDEALIFSFIANNLTIQHATLVNEIKLNDRLKSIRKREIEGEEVKNLRTSRKYGRQHFVYSVTGIGKQVNAPGLSLLNTFTIYLNELNLHNPNKFAEIYTSPHLTEFEEHALAIPVLLGGTRVDIEFFPNPDISNQDILYTFKRKNLTLVKKLKLTDFVFYGGNDVIAGAAYWFILLSRFVGEVYQQELISQLKNDHLSQEEKLNILSKAMTGLMPGSMLLEAKIPEEIKLDQSYTRFSTRVTTDEFGDNHCLSLEDDEEFLKSIEKASDSFPWTEEQKKQIPIDQRAEELKNIIQNIASETIINGPYSWSSVFSQSYLPADIYSFVKEKLIYSHSPCAVQLFTWFLDTPFLDKNGIGYFLNINERTHNDSPDLMSSTLNVRFGKKDVKINMLKRLLPKLNPNVLAKNFAKYVAIAAYESFGDTSKDKIVNFLLAQNIKLDGNDIDLTRWFEFENNDKLLEYIFDIQKLDVNTLCEGQSYLDYAIILGNYESAEWLIKKGARLHKCPIKDLVKLPDHLKNQLGIEQNISNPDKDAVVLVITGKTYDHESIVVLGRRRQDHKLEGRLSFPGGEIDEGETIEEAALRELQEETHLTLNKDQIKICEIAKIELLSGHQDQSKMKHLYFLHIDVGYSLKQSVWPGSDFAAVTKVRLNNCQIDVNGVPQAWNGLPIRKSNGIILQHIFQQQKLSKEMLSDLQLLLYAEAYPDSFLENYLFDQDKNDQLNILTLALQKGLPHKNKSNFLAQVISSGNVDMLKTSLENGYRDDLNQCESIGLRSLLANKNLTMLNFIDQNCQKLFHVSSSEWKEIEALLNNFQPDELPSEISECIKRENLEHIILYKLAVINGLRKFNASETAEQCKLKIKNDIEQYGQMILDKLGNDHIRLAILSGDVDLLKSFLKKPLCEYVNLNNNYFYSYPNNFFHLGLFFSSIEIIENLITEKKSDMLQFLQNNFPSAFECSDFRTFCDLAKHNNMTTLVDFILEINRNNIDRFAY